MRFKDIIRFIALLTIVGLILAYFMPPNLFQFYSLFNFPPGNYTKDIVNITNEDVYNNIISFRLGYNPLFLKLSFNCIIKPYVDFTSPCNYTKATLYLLSLNASMIKPTSYFEIANAFGAVTNFTPGQYVVNYTLHAFKIVNSSPNVLLILRLWNMTASPWYNVTYPPSSNISSISVDANVVKKYEFSTNVSVKYCKKYKLSTCWRNCCTYGCVTYCNYYYYYDVVVSGTAYLYINNKLLLNQTNFEVCFTSAGGTYTSYIYGKYDNITVKGAFTIVATPHTYHHHHRRCVNGHVFVKNCYIHKPIVHVYTQGFTYIIYEYRVTPKFVIDVYNGTDPVTKVGNYTLHGDGVFYVNASAVLMNSTDPYNVTYNVTTHDKLWFRINGSWDYINRTWFAGEIEIIPKQDVINEGNKTIYALNFTYTVLDRNTPPCWIFDNTFAEVYKNNYAYEMLQMAYYYTIYQDLFNFTINYMKNNPYLSPADNFEFEINGLVMQIAYYMNYTTEQFDYPLQALLAKEGNVMMRAEQQWYIASFGEWYYVHGNVSLMQETDVPPTFLNITLWNKEYNYSKQYITNYTNSYPPLVYWLGNGTKIKVAYFYIFIESIDPAYLGNTTNTTWVYENLDRVWIPQLNRNYTMYDFYDFFPLMTLNYYQIQNVTLTQYVNISYFYYQVWKNVGS